MTIPESVTSIKYSAFEGCTSLKTVYCKPTTPPTGGMHMFSNYGDSLALRIYVPVNSVVAYKLADEYWNAYRDRIVGYNF